MWVSEELLWGPSWENVPPVDEQLRPNPDVVAQSLADTRALLQKVENGIDPIFPNDFDDCESSWEAEQGETLASNLNGLFEQAAVSIDQLWGTQEFIRIILYAFNSIKFYLEVLARSKNIVPDTTYSSGWRNPDVKRLARKGYISKYTWWCFKLDVIRCVMDSRLNQGHGSFATYGQVLFGLGPMRMYTDLDRRRQQLEFSERMLKESNDEVDAGYRGLMRRNRELQGRNRQLEARNQELEARNQALESELETYEAARLLLTMRDQQ